MLMVKTGRFQLLWQVPYRKYSATIRFTDQVLRLRVATITKTKGFQLVMP